MDKKFHHQNVENRQCKILQLVCALVIVCFTVILLFSRPHRPVFEEIKRRRAPDVVIVGVKKSGTGTLKTFLNYHSMIECAQGEKHFFDEDFKFFRGYEWYVGQMPPARDDQVVVEKTPKYFITPRAADELRKMDATIMVLLRDPVDRVLSDYEHYKLEYNRPNVTIEQLIFDSAGRIRPNSEIIYPSLYAKHLSRWLSYFPLGKKLLILDGDNLKVNPWEELAQAQDFLGLDREITKDNFVFSEEKGFFCFNNNNNNEQNKEGEEPLCMGSSKGRRYGGQSEYVVEALRAFFGPLNEQLFEMLGRRFQWK